MASCGSGGRRSRSRATSRSTSSESDDPSATAMCPGSWPLRYYQTVFAREPGSAEMPSAGRPFTTDLVTALVAGGVADRARSRCTPASRPSRRENRRSPSATECRRATARLVNLTKRSGGRVIAVGTTVTRALETVADDRGEVNAGAGWTDLVLGPGPAGPGGRRAGDRVARSGCVPSAAARGRCRCRAGCRGLPRGLAHGLSVARVRRQRFAARRPAIEARRKSAGPGPCAVAGGPSGGAMAADGLGVLAVFLLLTACGGGGAVTRESSAGHSAAATSPRPTSPATVGFNLRPGEKPPVLAAGSKDPHRRGSEVVRDVFRPGRGLGTGHYRSVSDLGDKRAELPRLRWLHAEPDRHACSGRLGPRRPDSGRVGRPSCGDAAGEGRLRRRARDPRGGSSRRVGRERRARRPTARPNQDYARVYLDWTAGGWQVVEQTER